MNFNENLINSVRVREVLYNLRSQHYKNNVVRMELWSEIARELNCEVDVCQTRWKSLRRRYCEEIQKIRKTPSGSGVSIRKPWPYLEIMNFLNPFVENRPTSSSCASTPTPTILPSANPPQTSSESNSQDIDEHFDIDSLTSSPYEIVYSDEPLSRASSPGTLNRGQVPKTRKTDTSEAHNMQSRRGKLATNKNLTKIIEEELLKDQDEVDLFLSSLAPMLRSFSPATRLEIEIQFHTILLNKLREK
ncbi:hypothetical protein FQR65_LT08889 [Abscondita terminalis]|nr:hypothetical protein FQR65_LT19239 [Abscondita terminalis]KAF5301584.1 hypothetical protein FQR65_LT08889 [Abscondita terminalis]